MLIPKNNKVKPSLDYLHQYKVTKVTLLKSGFSIHFENGAKVEIHDKAQKADKPELVGLALVNTMYAGGTVTMQFGTVKRVENKPQVVDEVRVLVKRDEYKITDPRFEEAAWPGRSEK